MTRIAFTLVLALGVSPLARAQSPAASAASAAANEAGNGAATEISLTDAYRREFVFLAGQKRELERRLVSIERLHANEARDLESQLARLEARLLDLDARTQEMREQVITAEQAMQSTIDDAQLLEATLRQGATTLGDHGVTLGEPAGGEGLSESLRAVFTESVGALRKRATVQKAPGEFYLSDGTKVHGTVVRLGRIAAYGVSERGAGVLAPAGGGQLKQWEPAASGAARAIAGGEPPPTLAMFLYESLDIQVAEDRGQTPIEHIDAGGAIAWVIVILGCLGLLLAVVRAVLLVTSTSDIAGIERDLEPLLAARRLDEAAEKASTFKGAAARVVVSVVNGLKRGTGQIEEVISERLLGEGRRLHRFGAVILIIAAVSPLLGLLGTVTGMITTFDVITKFGTGDPKMLSGGISTALITTELGLIVAIPTLLLGNLLSGWGDRIEADIERVVLRVVNIYGGSEDDATEGELPAPTHDLDPS